LRNWLRKSVLAWSTISLLAQPAPPGKPAIALIDSSDAAQWRIWAGEAGWQVITPAAAANANMDTRVQALETAVAEAVQRGGIDANRIYLAGSGGAAAAVFYAIARVPDLWAAGVALGGSPQAAIDSDRLYAANFSNVPVLWISGNAADQTLAKRLQAAKMNLEWRNADQIPMSSVFEWLAAHARPEYPEAVDCETSSPAFAHCYWIQMTKFDAAERNDVLPSSHLEPAIVAALDLGGFGFKIDAPGPGVFVATLPEKYRGPLRVGDRLVELNGRDLADARQYVAMMAQIKEESPAAVMVLRGKDRIRIETNIVLPKRSASITARVQAKYDGAGHEIQILSRAVTGMRLTIPPPWSAATLNWNGVPLEMAEPTGCLLLSITKELENAAPCP
jgi:predicted esterase